jgi:hypothetical protein
VAQHDATKVDSYNTNNGDRVFRYDVNGVPSVAYIYADRLPQFLSFDTPDEADRVFTLSRLAADKRGNLREVESWERNSA